MTQIPSLLCVQSDLSVLFSEEDAHFRCVNSLVFVFLSRLNLFVLFFVFFLALLECNLPHLLPRSGFINGAEGALLMPSVTQTELVEKELFPLEKHQRDYFCSFKLLKRWIGPENGRREGGGMEAAFGCEQQTLSRARSVMRSSELGAG